MERTLDRELKKRLKLAILLTGGVFFAELIGGYLTNSLALLSDSLHVFMDVFALGLTLFSLYISILPPTEKRTYGLHRVEVFVSFINGASIFLISLFIFYKAYLRLMNPPEVETIGMFVIAVIGLIINIVVAIWLHGFAKKDLNVKSAFLHVVGDAAASGGVILGAIVIYLTGFYAIDPLISVCIAVIILVGASRIVGEASHILLEGVPKEIELNSVIDDIKGVEGVEGLHSLHVWSICHNIYALSAHVDIDKDHLQGQSLVLKAINERLATRHHIFYTTIQVECPACAESDIFRSITHKERLHPH